MIWNYINFGCYYIDFFLDLVYQNKCMYKCMYKCIEIHIKTLPLLCNYFNDIPQNKIRTHIL